MISFGIKIVAIFSEHPYINEDWKLEHKKQILNYIHNVPSKRHNAYALQYFFSECLSTVGLVSFKKVNVLRF